MSQISNQLLKLQKIAMGINALKTEDPELTQVILIIDLKTVLNHKTGLLKYKL